MQVHTGRRRGNREPHQSVKGGWGVGWGQVPNEGGGEATDSCRSIQKKERERTTFQQQQKKKKMSTAVQRGRGDARRGVTPQTGGAEAERIATAGVRSAAELGQCANLKHKPHGNRYVSTVV